MSVFRKVLRPKYVALGLIVAAPVAYSIVVAKDPDGNPRQAKPWQITAYQLIPLRAVSRLWGSFNSVTLPEWLRPYGYRLYSYLFGVNISEAADQNLKHYKNLGDFFYRKLKPGCRPIADALVTSPSDGTVLQFGELVDNDRIEKVKGLSFTVEGLLGDNNHNNLNLEKDGLFAKIGGVEYTVDDMVGNRDAGSPKDAPDATDKTKSVLDTPIWLPSSEDTKLFYCVIYLAPGDYHRFHSPVNWDVEIRRHFVGELFSVAPYFQNRLVDLFCLNERVALLGKWKYGFFSMTPVGATNVGSIIINFDKVLKTNTKSSKRGTCSEAVYTSGSSLHSGFPLQKGEEMGGFRLGSTVVLVFEAPKDFQFVIKPDSKIKMGEPLGTINQ